LRFGRPLLSRIFTKIFCGIHGDFWVGFGRLRQGGFGSGISRGGHRSDTRLVGVRFDRADDGAYCCRFPKSAPYFRRLDRALDWLSQQTDSFPTPFPKCWVRSPAAACFISSRAGRPGLISRGKCFEWSSGLLARRPIAQCSPRC
jgi:hypothetical protein